MKKTQYRVIFVDWYGTLSVSLFWGQFKDPLHRYNPFYPKITDTLFAQGSPLLTPWMRGELTSEQVLKSVADKTRLDYAMLFDGFVTSCREMTLVSDQVLALVDRIRCRGMQVVIATDNMDSFPRWTVPSLRLEQHFDDVLDSWRLRTLKCDAGPDGASLFFGPYLRKHHIAPHEALLIDDIKAAEPVIRAFGLDYRLIEFGVGLVPALTDLLESD